MIKSKYIYLKMKNTGLWYVVKLTGKKCQHYIDNETWEYVDVLATNNLSYTLEDINKGTSIDVDMLNKDKYPNVKIKYLTYNEAVAYAI